MAKLISSQSPQSSVSPWFELEVTEDTSLSTSTKACLKYSFYYKTKGSGYEVYSVARPYTISINGSVVKSGSVTVNGVTSTSTSIVSNATTYVDKGSSSKSIALSFHVDWKITYSGVYKESHDASGSISIPAIKTYAISYDANGGTGAPSNQTKTDGVNITLSSTKPTRTGYSFLNWNTKSDGSGSNYSPGGTYSSNSPLALYAQWDPIKYSVVYDANGGTGVIEQQTKIYGTNLQLTTTKPSRAYYDFINWCTDPNGLGDVYESGGVYTGNANLKLYAIWALAYVPPKISNITAVRCRDSSGSIEDTYQGTYARVEFDWECDQNLGPNPAVITVAGESISTGGSYSGHVRYTIARTRYSPELSYSISIVVQDNYEVTRSSISLTTSEYCIDFKAGGKGVCVGGVATKDRTFECAWPAEFKGDLSVGGKNLLDLIYPVGAIYISATSTDPAILFGGTWERIKDKFLLSAGDTYEAGSTGGEATHQLTIDEIPSHSHVTGISTSYSQYPPQTNTSGGATGWRTVAYELNNPTRWSDYGRGGDAPHNNMPPYLAVYMWKRTA